MSDVKKSDKLLKVPFDPLSDSFNTVLVWTVELSGIDAWLKDYGCGEMTA